MKRIRKFTKPIALLSLTLTLIVLSASNTLAVGNYAAVSATSSSEASANSELCSVAGVALIVAAVGAGAALVNAAYNLGTGIGQAAYHLANGAAAQVAYVPNKPYKATDFSTYDL